MGFSSKRRGGEGKEREERKLCHVLQKNISLHLCYWVNVSGAPLFAMKQQPTASGVIRIQRIRGEGVRSESGWNCCCFHDKKEKGKKKTLDKGDMVTSLLYLKKGNSPHFKTIISAIFLYFVVV